MLAVPRSWYDVTPAWITSALSSRLPGVVVGSVDVEPLGSGTNARARVALSFLDGEGPPSVFVKLSGRLGNRLALVALRALGTEARLAASRVVLPLDYPLPYAGGIDRRRLSAVVVTDDVMAAGGRPNDALRALSVDEVRSGLAGLAGLHAAYWDRRLPAGLAFLRPWRLGRSWSVVSAASLARGGRRMRGERGYLVPGGVKAGELAAQFRRRSLSARSGPQTVLHGDPHPGNTYALPGGRTGFFDWQLARTGNWVHDVGYFVVGSLDVADRRARERELLAGYLSDLREHGVSAAPGFDEAWGGYRATPAFGLATWVHTLSFGSFQPVDVCLATIGRFGAAYDDLETGRLA